MKLVDNWHRLWSVRVAAIGSLLMTALLAFPDVWAGLPPEIRSILPARLQALAPLLLLLATLAARLVKQKDHAGGK